jgi:hypothetical protein
MGKTTRVAPTAREDMPWESAQLAGKDLPTVFEISFMVKLLRACVGMPRRKQAKKDVVSCDKLRGDAHSL